MLISDLQSQITYTMTESSPFRIVIVGGGIAGLPAAIALRRPNRQITVLERSRLGKEIGAFISRSLYSQTPPRLYTIHGD
jgi:2-polyprenyl-6-methoxyphenol hydroxylase-like FAD-dependent oxidoreductase